MTCAEPHAVNLGELAVRPVERAEEAHHQALMQANGHDLVVDRGVAGNYLGRLPGLARITRS